MLFVQSNNFRLSGACVAFGNFDGLHTGHKKILSRLTEMEKRGFTSVMMQLDYQPYDLLGRHNRLTTREEMRSILDEDGPQIMVSSPFTAADTDMEPEEFIKLLVGKMGARAVVAGSDCRFGRNGRGDARLLKEYAALNGFEACIVDTVCDGGIAVNSGMIREDLLYGNLERANRQLGYPYTIRGNVVHGKALGRGAKMPTANLQAHHSKLIPAHGVYATVTNIDGEIFFGLTNIGLRPTVDNLQHVTVETYLLDFSRDIYNKTIETQLHLFIREVRKFNSLDEVKDQIDIDLLQVRGYFDKYSAQRQRA